MDVITHAIVGAATGLPFGRPVLGAVCAVLPDVVLGIKRRSVPSRAYTATHSVLFVLLGTVAAAALTNSTSAALCVLLSLASHLVLDVPTHGKTWAPMLLYPFSKKRYSLGGEWEFYNDAWINGLLLSILWVSLCLLINHTL